jgi:hypothetical protein
MPRGKVVPKQAAMVQVGGLGCRKVQAKDEWAGFVQISVNDAHREEYDLWLSEVGGNVWAELNDALSAGLKFTVSYDGSNMCYIASLTGRPDLNGERTFTACLSGRGGTFEEAIAVLIYKHTALLHYDWWDAVNEPKRARQSFG